MTELPNRLLRDALDDTLSTPPSTICVDVERLAAWADGTLTGAERAAIETHAAGCARCLGLLAAMTRTEPPRPERPWWRSPAVWLPLATVTAAVVIVVRLAVIERQSQMPAAVASSDASAVRPPASTTSPVPPAAAGAPRPAGASAQPSAPAVSSTSQASRRRESSAVDASPPPALAKMPKPSQIASAPPSPPPAAPEPATPAPASPPSSTAQLAAASPASPAPPARETAAKDTAKNTARETASLPPKSAVVASPAPAATPAPVAPPSPLRDEMARAQGANAFAARGMMKTAAPAPILIASPDRESQWRIVGGAVEHTNDGGGTWQTQALGVATPMRAGSAPDARVCWLAGVAGVVLRTTDGATWTRIPFPEAADLAIIQATDASHAIVTTVDGRHFTTRDGGASWVRQ